MSPPQIAIPPSAPAVADREDLDLLNEPTVFVEMPSAETNQGAEPISMSPRAPARSAEIFDLTYDGSFPARSTREDDSSGRETKRPMSRDADTAPLPPIERMVREVERESAERETVERENEARESVWLESEPDLGEISENEPDPSSEGEMPIEEPPTSPDGRDFPVQTLIAAEIEPIPVLADRAAPKLTETLAELYRTQGYVADARQTYQGLAEAEPDPARAREFRDRASRLPADPDRGPAARLREWAVGFPALPPARIEDLGRVLETLVESVPGIRAASLTDLEGLPLVSVGGDGSSSEMESLVAELTAFWKGVHRTRDEVGAGLLSTLTLSATDGAAIVSSVSSEYSLILKVDRDAPLGRIRYEAARAAGILRPALI